MNLALKSLLLVLALVTQSFSQDVCNILCDGRDAREASGEIRDAVRIDNGHRSLILYITDDDNMAFGHLMGESGEEIWVERTWNGGIDIEQHNNDSRLGSTKIPSNSNEISTKMFNVDNPSNSNRSIGALRACTVWPIDNTNPTCTPWARSKVNAGNTLDAAVTSLMMYYESWRGLWTYVGWWNSANDMTVLIDYQLLTGRRLYNEAINNTFELNKGLNEFGGINFTYGSVDDSLWWGLAWVKAYDLTKEQKYLDMAVFIADFCWQFHDDTCGGGLWWSERRQYKNAVTNEQYIKLAAQLHNRIEGDRKYLEQSRNLWTWFKGSGMINEENLINDGLHECRNNLQETWTYNQGIVLGGLVELWRATGDEEYISEGRKIADAVLNSSRLNDEHGILWENCFEDLPDCGLDAPCFKGIFMRNLLELNLAIEGRPYSEYILKQAESIKMRNRNELDQYGLRWSGPMDKTDASRQQSAVDALIAAEVVLNEMSNYIKQVI